MIDPNEFSSIEFGIEKLLKEKHGLSGGPIEGRLTKALRRAPRRVRKAAKGFLLIRTQMGNPKLMRTMDADTLREHGRTLHLHLESIDVADRRKGVILSILGGISFNLLAVFVLLMALLIWQGFV